MQPSSLCALQNVRAVQVSEAATLMQYLGHPPAWLVALLVVCFGLIVSAPCALVAAYLYSRFVARRVHPD